MKYIVLFFALLLAVLGRAADDVRPFFVTPEDIKYIYDGDTFYIYCRPGLKCKDGKLGVRAKDMDTPEMKGKCQSEIILARQAKQFVVKLVRNASEIKITPYKTQPYDRYDRLLAFVSFDGQDWKQTIIENKLGRLWTGRRESWCP